MSIAIYDASTGGDALYEEDLGTVTVNEYGIYSFGFGASGQSTLQREETIAFTDGVSKTFTGRTTATPLSNSVSVTDGTFNWNESEGNPGIQATATVSITNGFITSIPVIDGGAGYTAAPVVTIDGDGSGASASATLSGDSVGSITVSQAGSGYTNATASIENPPILFSVTESEGNLTFQYEETPPPGREIIASYTAQEPSLTEALSRSSQPWLELSVNGVPQAPRERVLSVPYAQVALTVPKAEILERRLDYLINHLAQTIPSSIEIGNDIVVDEVLPIGGSPGDDLRLDEDFQVQIDNKLLKHVTISITKSTGNQRIARVRYDYSDGTHSTTSINAQSSIFSTIPNPFPEKEVTKLGFSILDHFFRMNWYDVVAFSSGETEIIINHELSSGTWTLGRIIEPWIQNYNITYELVDSAGKIIASLTDSSPTFRIEENTTINKVIVEWKVKRTPKNLDDIVTIKNLTLFGPQ